jgi:hypothetical protein
MANTAWPVRGRAHISAVNTYRSLELVSASIGVTGSRAIDGGDTMRKKNRSQGIFIVKLS